MIGGVPMKTTNIPQTTSFSQFHTRNQQRRTYLRTGAYILAILQTLAVIYVDPWMLIFAIYHLWLTQFPKEVWSFQSRSDAVAAVVAGFVGIIVALFSLPYFPIVYFGWFLTWQMYRLIIGIVANDCYWCHLKKPKDEFLYCPDCDYASSAKTAASFKKHWKKQHDGDDDVYSTICQEHMHVH